MTPPRVAPFTPTGSRSPQPLTGGERLAARASLAARRTSRFARVWTISLGSLVLIVLFVPFASGDPHAADRGRQERLAADTLLTAQRFRSAELAVASAESLVNAALAEVPRRPLARAVAATTTAVSTSGSLASLEASIQEARRLRTIPSWLAVARHPIVSAGPRMRALADSLTLYAERRDALRTGLDREQRLVELSQRISRTGYTILSIAETRRSELAAQGVALVPETSPRARVLAQVEADAPVARMDTAGLQAALVSAREALAAARRRHDSVRVALRALDESLASDRRSPLRMASPAIVLAVVLLFGLVVRFTAALRREMKSPTLAHAREAEGASGALVLATVRDALLDGPARFRPSGVDPFRMLYLGLTATGTRTRTAIVTGSDPVIAAAVGARLAIAAAADHRATLVVDLDPTEIALSRTFRERPEPGLTEALAGAFKWREIARAVGSSDGLPITLLPAGTERDEFGPEDAVASRRAEFSRFRAMYELTIVVAPLSRLDLATSLVESSPVLITASTGRTEVARFIAESTEIRAAGRRIHGTVLWDAPRPELLSRGELAALLSKQKGRTPGGSFEAVRRAVRDPHN